LRPEQGGGAVGEGTGKRHGKLAAAAVGALLTFRIGVSEEAADGKQENGAQAQTEPGCDQNASSFADDDRGYQYEEQGQATGNSVRDADSEADERQQGEECVDAQFDAHPAAHRIDQPLIHEL